MDCYEHIDASSIFLGVVLAWRLLHGTFEPCRCADCRACVPALNRWRASCACWHCADGVGNSAAEFAVIIKTGIENAPRGSRVRGARSIAGWGAGALVCAEVGRRD